MQLTNKQSEFTSDLGSLIIMPIFSNRASKFSPADMVLKRWVCLKIHREKGGKRKQEQGVPSFESSFRGEWGMLWACPPRSSPHTSSLAEENQRPKMEKEGLTAGEVGEQPLSPSQRSLLAAVTAPPVLSGLRPGRPCLCSGHIFPARQPSWQPA